MTLSKSEIYLLIFAFLLSVCSGILIYTTISTPATSTTENIEISTEVEMITAPKVLNSTMANHIDRLNEFDQALAMSDLVPQEQIELLIRKGYYLSHPRSASSIEDSLRDSMDSFKEAEKVLTAHPELSVQYSVPIKFGLLYNFAVNCFPTLLGRSLPSKHIEYVKTLFPTLPRYDVTSSESILTHQKAAFIAMLDYAYNDVDLAQSTDKSVISHRMLVASIYLASFADSLSAEEKAGLVAKINDDLKKYGQATFTIFSNKGVPYQIMGELQSSFHYALAYDISQSYDGSPVTNLTNESVDSNYTKVIGAIANSPSEDKVALAVFGTVVNGYYLSSLERRYGASETSKPLYTKTIADFKKQVFEYPETADIMKGSLNYTLSLQGQWAKEKGRIFAVAKQEPELAAVFNSLGIVVN